MIRTDRVLERMEALGLSAHAAAKQAGLGPDFVRDIIRGRTKDPSGWRLRQLAEVLQCSADYLQGISDDLGVAPRVLQNYDERIARLHVRYELKEGYFHEPATRVWTREHGKYDQHFAVISQADGDEDEWLELVIDPQYMSRFSPGDLLHVVEFRDVERDCLVVVNHFEGDLISRSVHSLTFDRTGAYLWPTLEGVDSDAILNVVAGEESDRFAIVGWVRRAYVMTDGTGPISFFR